MMYILGWFIVTFMAISGTFSSLVTLTAGKSFGIVVGVILITVPITALCIYMSYTGFPFVSSMS